MIGTEAGSAGAEHEERDLCEDLRRPEAFPSPRPRAVQIATTHASWVFLTEHEAWKVKRPVDFGFLDYGDRDKRRRACEDEVRLGARLAPEVYRGVAPIFGGPAGASFVGPGPVIDHAVRMRRLHDEDSALSLLRAGALGAAELARVAELLGGFYRSAPETPGLGAPAILAANIEENYAQTLPYAGRFVNSGTLRALYGWQRATLAALGPLLGERIDQGHIREGHGDLRLEHVYFPDGPDRAPVIIDPIEFNRRFRCQDVALDVAFLAMELLAQGRADLAAFFLGSFARETNDYGFYPLLDLYLSYRAWVRAKVACFVAADPKTPPQKAARKAREAAELFGLAEAHTRGRPRCNDVIAVGGIIGAGKSVVADALCAELAIPVVSSDACRKALGGVRPSERGGRALYTPQMDERTHEEMVRHARAVLASGRGVILDATFRAAARRRLGRELARAAGRRFLFVEVVCDEATTRARLRERQRGPSMSDAGEELYERMKRAYEPPEELGEDERVQVDGRAPPEETARRIRALLAG